MRSIDKDFWREIRYTLNRFLSIIMIVALGVAFFSGVRASCPDMKLSADAYLDDTNFMDIRVLSTLGLSEDDIKTLSQIQGVEEVEAAYSYDVFCQRADEKETLKLMSQPQSLNQEDIVEGRGIEADNECVVDEYLLSNYGYKIGDEIHLVSGDDGDLEDALNTDTFTIVGAATTSYYLTLKRESTTIGDGEIDAFVYISREAFNLEAYTVAYLTVAGAKSEVAFSEDYDAVVENVTDQLENIKAQREQARYEEIKSEADDKIADARKEYEEAKAEAESELADAEEKIAEAESELAQGREDLESERADYERQIADARQTLADGTAQLADGDREVADGIVALQNAEAEIANARATLDAQRGELSTQQAMLEQFQPVTEEEQAQYAAMKAQLDAGWAQWNGALAQIQANEAQIAAQWQGIYAGQAALDDSRNQLAQGRVDLEDKIAEAEEAFAEAEAEIADGEQELADAKEAYQDAKEEASEKLADGLKEIEAAEAEIADLKECKWYVLDRNSTQAYAEFSQNADRIGAIGRVFPLIFFLVAALVSLTTMTRMVESQRTQIGTLKALGYGKWQIAKKYVLYALLASAIGSGIGLVVGQKLLPWIIVNAYKILYPNLPQVLTPLNLYYSVTSIVAAVACVTLSAFAACYKELIAVPANLMRPVAPKVGKRIFLERFTPLWSRLKFTSKVALRNLFRYKKRFLMTIFGIGGCTALVIVGFGITDSIFSVVPLQYGELCHYKLTVEVDPEASDGELQEIEQFLDMSNHFTDYTRVRNKNVDLSNGKSSFATYLIIPEEKENFDTFITFRDRLTKEPYTLSDEGVILTEKMSDLLGVGPGDMVTFSDDEDEQVSVKVEAVTENYLMSYMYMSSTLYTQVFNKSPEYNQMMVLGEDLSEETEESVSTALLQLNGVTGTHFTSASRANFDEMLGSLNVITIVLIISAGLLAFIVLYNLNNINITERKRELATIKVLGFYDLEVAEYVYRENIMLTLIGAILGMGFGYYLHQFIITTVETELIMFHRAVDPISYVYAVGITFGFSIFVNFMMYFRLKKVDMVESMKSVE